jgi:Flp pilus assembly protein CpaB
MPGPLPRIRSAFRRFRRAVLARRRLLAALFAALAVAGALRANAEPPPPRIPVVVADHDIPAGATLTGDDVVRVGFAPGTVPDGVLAAADDAVGRTTVGPVRAGEPLTDVRLLGAGLLERYPGTVAAPVRLGDRATVDLLRVGDRIDILAADPQGSGPAVVAAHDVPLIAIPPARDDSAGLTGGGLILVAVPDDTAQVLAGHGVRSFLSAVIVR